MGKSGWVVVLWVNFGKILVFSAPFKVNGIEWLLWWGHLWRYITRFSGRLDIGVYFLSERRTFKGIFMIWGIVNTGKCFIWIFWFSFPRNQVKYFRLSRNAKIKVCLYYVILLTNNTNSLIIRYFKNEYFFLREWWNLIC